MRCRRMRLTPSPPTKRAATTRPCSIPRSPTRRTAPNSSPTFFSRSPSVKGDWTMAAFRDEEIARIRTQVGKSRVICGLVGRSRIRQSRQCSSTRRSATSSPACSSTTGSCGKAKRTKWSNLFRGHFNIPLVHVDAARRVHSRRSRASKTPRPSARRSAGCSSTRSRRRRIASRATAKGRSTFWRRARSIPT